MMLRLGILAGALAVLALTGCGTLELRQPIGSRGEYGEVFAGYQFPNLDDPTESPSWLYPEYKAESGKLKAEMRNVK